MYRLFAVFIYCVHALDYYDSLFDFLKWHKRSGPIWNASHTIFSEAKNYHVNSTPTTEDSFPWIARVVHSKNYDKPHMCTAVCIEARLFITAGICLYSRKVSYTSVVYQELRIPVIAFVMPSKMSKQAFDDISFIVVNDTGLVLEWNPVRLFDTTNRTDEEFGWFARLHLPEDTTEHIVVGYASEKGSYAKRTVNDLFNLTKLDVFVNKNLCPEILSRGKIDGYRVPCYHSCSVSVHKMNEKCTQYHGCTGSAVYNVKTEKLLGIVTWATYSYYTELPVGFSVPNSNNFFEDYTCARKIKNDNSVLIEDGYYQDLCNK